MWVLYVWFLFCYASLSVLSSFAIILTRKGRKKSWLLYFYCLLMSCDFYMSLALPHDDVSRQDPEGGDRGSGPPPGKSQVIWVSIGNKQMDPHPEKSLIPPEECLSPLEP